MTAPYRWVHCPYCDQRINPGQLVVHVDDDDPWKELWHQGCREMWDYDQKLASAMASAATAPRTS
jgi:hypothetical protein